MTLKVDLNYVKNINCGFVQVTVYGYIFYKLTQGISGSVLPEDIRVGPSS